MFKTESKTIGGFEYRITQLGVDAGLDVGVLIIRALGPSLIALMGGESLATVNKGALGDALAKISSSEIKFLCKAFAEKTFVVIGPQITPRLDHVWDTATGSHFAGRYRALIDWLVACVALNFPDFLEFSGSEKMAPDEHVRPAQNSSKRPSPTA